MHSRKLGNRKGLTNFSVVQRQIYLMKIMTKEQAYDIARKEFYALRHAEEVERRVAREEALWVGAYFGKGQMEIGMELEDKIYEKWKVWALKEIQTMELQRDAAYTNISTESEDDAAIDPPIGDVMEDGGEAEAPTPL
jgi:small subunit ribosomal protein S23